MATRYLGYAPNKNDCSPPSKEMCKNFLSYFIHDNLKLLAAQISMDRIDLLWQTDAVGHCNGHNNDKTLIHRTIGMNLPGILIKKKAGMKRGTV